MSILIQYCATCSHTDPLPYDVTPYILNSVYLTLHNLLDLLQRHLYFCDPVQLNVIIYYILKYYVYFSCFPHVLPNPRIPVALYGIFKIGNDKIFCLPIRALLTVDIIGLPLLIPVLHQLNHTLFFIRRNISP